MSLTGFGYKNKFDPRRKNDTSYQGVKKRLKLHNSVARDDFHCTGRIRTKWGFDQSCLYTKTRNVEVGGTLTGLQQRRWKLHLGGLVGWWDFWMVVVEFDAR